VPPSILQPHTRFIEDLQCTDLDSVELLMAFEEAFKIKIPETDSIKILTIGDLIRYL
jgi:acyl carrier protein